MRTLKNGVVGHTRQNKSEIQEGRPFLTFPHFAGEGTSKRSSPLCETGEGPGGGALSWRVWSCGKLVFELAAEEESILPGNNRVTR